MTKWSFCDLCVSSSSRFCKQKFQDFRKMGIQVLMKHLWQMINTVNTVLVINPTKARVCSENKCKTCICSLWMILKGLKIQYLPPLIACQNLCLLIQTFPYIKEVQQVGELLANASKLRQLFSGKFLFWAIIGPFLALLLKMIQLFFPILSTF